jgi:hypothetical protein
MPFFDLLKPIYYLFEAPPNSLVDSIVNPKVTTIEG